MRTILVTALIIVIAAVAFVAGDRYGKKVQDRSATGTTERSILYYTDPMNPGFRSEQPGTAPCGMPLEPV